MERRGCSSIGDLKVLQESNLEAFANACKVLGVREERCITYKCFSPGSVCLFFIDSLIHDHCSV